MFGNYLAAALSNLNRNPLYAAISILGLAIGMAAAILAGLYIRDELGFDRFIPGHRNVYVVVTEFDLPGRPPLVTDLSHSSIARLMKLDFRQVQAVARLGLSAQRQGVRRGNVETLEDIGWADPDLFSILALPVLAGDPVATLHRPDGAVITRAMARKLFGQDAPIGRVLELNHAVQLRVGAVLKDLPSNTHLVQQIYISSLNPASPSRVADAAPAPRGALGLGGRTYVRFAGPQGAAEVDAGMGAFLARRLALADGKMSGGVAVVLRLVPLASLHLQRFGGVNRIGGRGDAGALAALGLLAVLILVVAGVNFVNLTTARASRRAVEVGVRKATGARRGDLIVQFVGEATIQALIGLVLALAAVELVLPGVRVLLDRPLNFAYWREPGMLAAVLSLGLAVGVLAGAYPALVQASFRPARVLKGVSPQPAGSEAVRAGLATLQFALLIGLILAVVVVGRQTLFALNEGLGLDKARMVMMDIAPPPDPAARPGPPRPLCRDAFPDQVRQLPGVQAAACSSRAALDLSQNEWSVEAPGGARQGVGHADVDYGFFELYGLKPVAGRFFSRDHPGDELSLGGPPPHVPKTAVINRRAALALGFASPAQAVGRSFRIQPTRAEVQIVGVVPDFAFDLTLGDVRPVVYTLMPPALDHLNIKLIGRDVPQTMRAIDALWRDTGSTQPPNRRFVDDYLRTLYAGTIRQGYLVDALCGVAVLVACLGLLGLAAFTVERRTKEIGVRQAMGASPGDVVRLLLWRLARPVLWANLIAWPAGWWAMDRWLQGFSARIALQPWFFLAASAAALVIACGAVAAQAMAAARRKPISALRYE